MTDLVLLALQPVQRPGDPMHPVDQPASPRVYINQVRRKLEPEPSRPRHFLTEPGMGYRFLP